MADAIGFEKSSKVSRTRGWPQVPAKWQVPSLKMGKHLFNGGWKGLLLQAGLEHTIEEFIRDTCLEPEETSIVVQFCLGKAAKKQLLIG
jgi:hypothetical protein